MKNVLLPKKILDAADLSDDLTSLVIDIRYLDNVFVQVDMDTADAAGTFTFEVSNNYSINADGTPRDAGTWVIVPDVSTTITAGAPNPIGVDLNQLGAAFFRMSYAQTGGTGTVTAIVSAKGV